jgi:hypothetical protein
VEGGGCADFAGFLGVDLMDVLGWVVFRLNGRNGDSLLGGWPLRLDLLWRRAFWAWSLGGVSFEFECLSIRSLVREEVVVCCASGLVTYPWASEWEEPFSMSSTLKL